MWTLLLTLLFIWFFTPENINKRSWFEHCTYYLYVQKIISFDIYIYIYTQVPTWFNSRNQHLLIAVLQMPVWSYLQYMQSRWVFFFYKNGRPEIFNVIPFQAYINYGQTHIISSSPRSSIWNQKMTLYFLGERLKNIWFGITSQNPEKHQNSEDGGCDNMI